MLQIKKSQPSMVSLNGSCAMKKTTAIAFFDMSTYYNNHLKIDVKNYPNQREDN